MKPTSLIQELKVDFNQKKRKSQKLQPSNTKNISGHTHPMSGNHQHHHHWQ
jgi:hypothetical protein